MIYQKITYDRTVPKQDVYKQLLNLGKLLCFLREKTIGKNTDSFLYFGWRPLNTAPPPFFIKIRNKGEDLFILGQILLSKGPAWARIKREKHSLLPYFLAKIWGRWSFQKNMGKHQKYTKASFLIMLDMQILILCVVTSKAFRQAILSMSVYLLIHGLVTYEYLESAH